MPRLNKGGCKPGQKHAGQFKPGQSGNPGGRPVGTFKLALKAQEFGQEALDFIVEVMRDETEEKKNRMYAASEILDRGFGKPKQTSEVTGVEGGPFKLIVEVVKL